MKKSSEDFRRPDLRRSFDRDMQRYRARESGHRSFWRSLSVLGSIGWPIVSTMVGGAWLGRWLDQRFGTGTRLTLMLVFVGAILGSLVAWSVIKGTKK